MVELVVRTQIVLGFFCVAASLDCRFFFVPIHALTFRKAAPLNAETENVTIVFGVVEQLFTQNGIAHIENAKFRKGSLNQIQKTDVVLGALLRPLNSIGVVAVFDLFEVVEFLIFEVLKGCFHAVNFKLRHR